MSIVTYNNRSIANISAIPGAAKALTHIKTLTASSSSTLSFVNGSSDVVLDSTYPIYIFKFINVHPSQSNRERLMFQGSTDSGSNYNTTVTTTIFDAYHDEADGTATVGKDDVEDVTQSTSFAPLTPRISSDNDSAGCGEMFLFKPSSTTFVKHFMFRGPVAFESGGGDPYIFDRHLSGYFNTTSAIDALQFKFDNGNIDAGTIKLYGLKDS
tara:strand:+ start:217 stop:852 length:636 start_codon:yes stop_codon:yes gene_type:complete